MQLNFDIPAANRNPMVDEILRQNQEKAVAPDASVNPDSPALASFNGYYSIGTEAAPGAFLTIDTNINVTCDAETDAFSAAFDVSVILCPDGKTPYVFDFSASSSATFTLGADGVYQLTLSTAAGVTPAYAAALSFTRTGMTEGKTAKVSGSITIGDAAAVSVSGFTYNNPILPSLYSGNYYTHPSIQNSTVAQVLTIGDNFELYYTPLGDSGVPAKITSYSYNMNMYFFSFNDSNGNQTKLIMGTSAAGGLVSNNMTIIDKVAHPRTLTTIKLSNQSQPDTSGVTLSQTNAKALADLSGYFPLTATGGNSDTVTNGAFLSVEGQYVSSYLPAEPPVIDTRYKVCIGICLDGVHSTVYYFDEACSFDPTSNTLTITGVTQGGVQGSWVITFAPGYSAGTGSYSEFGDLGSVQMTFSPSGSAAETATESYSGRTPLGPVPLSAFSGATLTSTTAGSNEALEIVSDHSILYTPPALSQAWDKDDRQQAWLDILYVPLMYIVAYQVRPDDILDPDPGLVSGMLSLGTNGRHGLASINTRYLHLWPGLPPIPCPPTSVEALPNA